MLPQSRTHKMINQQNLTNHTRIYVLVIEAGRAHAWIGPLIEFTHYNKNKSTLQAGLCTLCSVCLVWEHHSAYHFLLATHFSCLHHHHAFSSSLVALTLQEMCEVITLKMEVTYMHCSNMPSHSTCIWDQYVNNISIPNTQIPWKANCNTGITSVFAAMHKLHLLMYHTVQCLL